MKGWEVYIGNMSAIFCILVLTYVDIELQSNQYYKPPVNSGLNACW
jgi:hypothetical protein